MLNTLNALNQLSGDFFTRATCFRYVDMTQAELASLKRHYGGGRGACTVVRREVRSVGFVII